VQWVAHAVKGSIGWSEWGELRLPQRDDFPSS
jgi:hypothetical protein